MKVSAIMMSRVLAYVDTADLSPTHGIPVAQFVDEITKQFHFQKFPQTLEEFDAQKGIEFLSGSIGKKAVNKFVVWPNIVVIEARSSTDDCKAMMDQMLQWATDKFKLNYSPDMVRHYAYVSDISFTSTAPILEAYSLLARIAEKAGAALTEIWHEPISYELFDLKIGHDPLARQWGIAPFQITRRVGHKFSEGKYFSEAPLPTDMHIALLEEYEAGIIALQGKSRIQ